MHQLLALLLLFFIIFGCLWVGIFGESAFYFRKPELRKLAKIAFIIALILAALALLLVFNR